MEEDTILLERYRNGDVEAMALLVERYRRPLFGYLLNMTSGRVHESEDVFQEVWIRVVRKESTYRNKNFLGWLIRIAHNLVIDGARKRKPSVSLDADDGRDGQSLLDRLPGIDVGPEANLEALDIGQEIARAVAELPKEQKEVFVMRAQSELTFKEIAEVQQVSINTALARMQYAVEKLRPVLRKSYEEVSGLA